MSTQYPEDIDCNSTGLGRKPKVTVFSSVSVTLKGYEEALSCDHQSECFQKLQSTPLETVVSNLLEMRWDEGVKLKDVVYHLTDKPEQVVQMEELAPLETMVDDVLKMLGEIETPPRGSDVKRALECVRKMSAKPRHQDEGYLGFLEHKIIGGPHGLTGEFGTVVDSFLDSNTTNKIMANILYGLGAKAEQSPAHGRKMAISAYALGYAFESCAEFLDR